MQAAVALGIGLGSVAAGFLSGGKIEYGLIPLGSLGMTILGLALAIPGLWFVTVFVLLAALGFASGFFIVPVSALLQQSDLIMRLGRKFQQMLRAQAFEINLAVVFC